MSRTVHHTLRVVLTVLILLIALPAPSSARLSRTMGDDDLPRAGRATRAATPPSMKVTPDQLTFMGALDDPRTMTATVSISNGGTLPFTWTARFESAPAARLDDYAHPRRSPRLNGGFFRHRPVCAWRHRHRRHYRHVRGYPQRNRRSHHDRCKSVHTARDTACGGSSGARLSSARPKELCRASGASAACHSRHVLGSRSSTRLTRPPAKCAIRPRSTPARRGSLAVLLV